MQPNGVMVVAVNWPLVVAAAGVSIKGTTNLLTLARVVLSLGGRFSIRYQCRFRSCIWLLTAISTGKFNQMTGDR